MTSGVLFRYRAAQRSGLLESGAIAADSRDAAAAALTARGLFPIEIQEAPARQRTGVRLPAAELALGLRLLATLLGSGLTVARSLTALEELVPPRWKTGMPAMREAVHAGRSLAAALRGSGLAFPPAVLGIIEAGEAGSGLAAAVRRSADLAERDAAVRLALRSALAYPALLAIAGAASLALLVAVVLPRFAEILGDLGQALPPATRLVLDSAAVVRAGFVPAVVGTALLAVLWRAWVSTAAGRENWDAMLLTWPVIGRIRRSAGVSRATLALSVLLESGVPIATALVHATQAAGDRALAARLGSARERVTAGERISTAMAQTDALTATAVRLIRAGEESGELPALLAHAAVLESDRAERTVRGAVRLLEPALIIGFGGVVALIAAALLQAIYGVRPV